MRIQWCNPKQPVLLPMVNQSAARDAGPRFQNVRTQVQRKMSQRTENHYALYIILYHIISYHIILYYIILYYIILYIYTLTFDVLWCFFASFLSRVYLFQVIMEHAMVLLCCCSSTPRTTNPKRVCCFSWLNASAVIWHHLTYFDII